MDTEHRPDEEKNQEEYSFIQEIIKDEKMDARKLTAKIGKWLCIGFLFGAAACVGFFALRPWAETTFQKDPDKVEIPLDDENAETETPEVTDSTEQELTIQNYRELNEQLEAVALEAEKSIVQVTGIRQDENWASGQNATLHQISGLIVADNGPELLILTRYSDMKEAELFRVKFADSTEHEAVMKQKDGNSDLAIFSVAKDGITDDTWSKIKVAVLGNSHTLTRGRALIALGSPFGYEDGIGYGVASTVDETIILADGEYRILVTDMPGTKKCNGFLFDSYGSVMGIINSDLIGKDGDGTLTVIGISAVKSEIELMSNGKNVSYVGIIGTMVTEEMSQAQGIPVGLYVTEVEVDSPAMKAGIQSGDVITEIDGKKITSVSGYHKAVIGQEAGKTINLTGQRYGAENYVDIEFHVTVGVKQ